MSLQRRSAKVAIASALSVGLLVGAFDGHALDRRVRSSPAASAVSVSIGRPVSSAATLVGPTLAIEASVASTYDLKSVHAAVETLGIDLSPPTSSGAPWTGTLDVDALPRVA